MTPEVSLLIAVGFFEQLGRLADTYLRILAAPWAKLEVLWAVIPVYASLVIGIFFQAGKKATWGSTVASGFALVWVTANWSRHTILTIARDPSTFEFFKYSLPFLVTLCCMTLGVVAIILGFRKKAPRVCRIIGHFTFNTYILISIYPMQAHLLDWTVERFAAIALFAPLFWLGIFLLTSTRRLKKLKAKKR
jgi:uncharacterized membrane protein YhdT